MPGLRYARVLVAPLVLASAMTAGCTRSAASEEPRGDALFASACARCHGADGAGGPALASGQTPRNLRDHTFQAARTDAELRRIIAQGKPPGMPAFARTFDDAQVGAPPPSEKLARGRWLLDVCSCHDCHDGKSPRMETCPGRSSRAA